MCAKKRPAPKSARKGPARKARAGAQEPAGHQDRRVTNYCTNFAPAQTADLLFRYSFTSHEGGRVAGGARDFGWAAANPLVPVCIEGKQSGPLRPVHSFAAVEPANVMLLALKRAEDGGGLIVRLIETDGKAVEAAVRLPFIDITQAYLTNVVEENQTILRCGAGGVTVPVDAWGITTIRVLPR